MSGEEAWREWLGDGAMPREFEKGFLAGYEARNAEVEALRAERDDARKTAEFFHSALGHHYRKPQDPLSWQQGATGADELEALRAHVRTQEAVNERLKAEVTRLRLDLVVAGRMGFVEPRDLPATHP